MGKQLESLTTNLTEFIRQQKMFFVGTAMKEGRVNISPKGMDTFRVLGANRIVWLNLTGSGNETATHLLDSSRMTIMFCAFEGKPLILRLYGTAKAYHERDKEFHEHIDLFPEDVGSRQIIVMEIDLVQTSCGYGIPFMDYKEERTILKTWAEKKGKQKIEAYWKEKNSISLDGHATGIVE
ncbi:pyridoxamine 5'-phosphate oxidase family protein [Aureispira anguillae]|uniref:Pyridoxamine 5'-phosphate oxidase family protein n=1 Tax=Aureispira anguillae TaxID=2864201 RepID=A0A916DTU9_9BACT|nr:pyridoxamine 5'-phosphate oxidase family protein [Aureispira anguillae]BDS11756.1 pyridoxamine 5'-phosphate oxidase family protein [Aureispira anguillae]